MIPYIELIVSLFVKLNQYTRFRVYRIISFLQKIYTVGPMFSNNKMHGVIIHKPSDWKARLSDFPAISEQCRSVMSATSLWPYDLIEFDLPDYIWIPLERATNDAHKVTMIELTNPLHYHIWYSGISWSNIWPERITGQISKYKNPLSY